MSHQKHIMGVFNESIMVKIKFEVTMVCVETGERPWAWRAWYDLHQISKYSIKLIKNCSGYS